MRCFAERIDDVSSTLHELRSFRDKGRILLSLTNGDQAGTGSLVEPG